MEFGRFISEDNQVDWEGVRTEYFKSVDGGIFIPKKYVDWIKVESNLVSFLIDRGVLSSNPAGNFLIIRSGHLWGPYSYHGGHCFFIDKKNAKEYIRAFSFKHGSLDRGIPEIFRCVAA